MFENLKFKIKNSRISDSSGQSLIEIIIALAIGALLIGAASTAVVIVLQSSTTGQRQQSTTVLAQDIIERARIYAEASWGNIYDLSKGSSTTYYFNTTSTQIFVIEGEEGVVDNDIRSGLVGYWKFDEASSTAAYDYSGNDNDGVLMGGVTRATSTCKVSYCLEFDGSNDYVTSGNVLNMGENDFSISAWVKSESTQTGNSNGIVYKRGTAYSYSKGYRLNMPNGIFNLHIADETNWKYVTAGSSGQYNDGNWHHVVGVADRGNELRIYVDGVSINSTSETNVGNIDSTVNFAIGALNTSGTAYYHPFNGLIDDVRVYNRALSADEVEHLYNSTLFTRYFYVENVSRDSSGDIVTSGGTDDPSTQKATVIVKWEAVQGSSQFALSEYIIRWRNRVFRQTDWSGGSGQEGPITVPSNKYASSTDIDISSLGLFRIEGL